MPSSKTFKIFYIKCFFLTLSFLMPICLYADEEETAALTMQIPSICKLTIHDSDQIFNLLQDASGEEAYEAGYIEGTAGKPRLIVDSNTNWKLTVKVSLDWMSGGGYQKDTGDLRLKVTSSAGHQTGFTGFTPLSLSDQEIASYAAGAGGEVYDGQYRILLDWQKDTPGVYIIITTYTLSTQAI